MDQLRSRRRLIFAVAVVALVAIQVLAPRYGALQLARDAEEFRRLLPADQRGRYLAGALADLVFAAAYGLAALAVATKSWVSRAGGALVALGAIADELENAFVIRNVRGAATLDDSAVETMRAFGTAKWLIVPGLVLLFAAYVWTRRDEVGEWIEKVRVRYLVFLLLVVAMVPAAGFFRQPVLVAVLLFALSRAGSWLNDLVRETRAAVATGGRDFGPARGLLAVVQLAAGVALVALGTRFAGRGWDGLFFVGVALVVMSLGAFVSELRQNTRFRPARGPVLVLAAVVLLAAATMTSPGASLSLILAGLLVGEIGAELLSEDYQSSPAPPVPGWVVGLAGAFVLCVGVALLVGQGADPGHVLPVVAVLAVVVFMASTDGDALIVVFVVAVALVWATTPRSDTPDDRLVAVPGEPYFAVLGDSYISGEGAERFVAGTNEKIGERSSNDDDHTNECRQATTAWPFQLAAKAAAGESRVPSRVLFLGCSGAVSENIHTEPRLDRDGDQHGPRELSLLERERRRLGRAPDFVVLSIGGNDAGFGDIGQTCVAPGNCAEVGEQFLRSPSRRAPDQRADGPPGIGRPEALAFVGDDLDAAYRRVKGVVPGVPVVAVAYPIPVNETGRCRGVLLDRDERLFVRGFVPELNAVVRDAAARNGLHFMDTTEEALRRRGAQLCGQVAGRAGLNFFALNPTSGSIVDSLSPKNWTHNSLHPNAGGHAVLADAANDWFERNWPLAAPPPPPPEPHRVASIRQVLGGNFVAQCDPETRRSCRVDGGVWVSEQLHAFYAASLFPVAVTVAGLWLCLAPLLRRGRAAGVTIGSLVWPGLRDGASRLRRGLRWLWGPAP